MPEPSLTAGAAGLAVQPVDAEAFWDDILAHLRQRVLLPVVGPDLVAVAEGGRVVNLSRLIGERLLQRSRIPAEWEERSSLEHAVRMYLAAKGRDQSDRLYRVVNDILTELQPDPPESLRNLARIADIPFFISTSFDSLLARAIDDIRFSGRHVTRELWFSPNQGTAEQQRNGRPPGPDETVVFKLFGEASSMPQYVIHEEDVLEWLHALLTETARLPEWLTYRLKESPLLFVGCQIPDWVIRFLVRLGSKTRLASAGNQIFIVASDVAQQRALAAFFRAYCGSARVQILDADPAAFIAELRTRWEARSPPKPVGVPAVGTGGTPARGDIFISYVREDVVAARRLSEAIAAVGGEVWLDEQRLQPGDRWDGAILESIRRDVRLFVPVISAQTEGREEGYVFKEWGEAVERARGIPRRRFIVPIVIDADYTGDPTRYRQVPQEFMAVHFGCAPDGVPDDALIATLTGEIRAMRRGEAG